MKHSVINYKTLVFCLSFLIIGAFVYTKMPAAKAFGNLTVSAGDDQNSDCAEAVFERTPAFATDPAPRSGIIEDFDGDGKLDVATGGMRVSVLRNLSAGEEIVLAPKVTLNSAASGFVIASGDFDGDGLKDIVTANFSTTNVSVFRNASAAGMISFVQSANFTVGEAPGSITVADFDGDGKLDVATANFGSNSVSVLRNSSTAAGNINFAPAVNVSIGARTRSILAADFNGDGKPDLAVANEAANGDAVSILRNISSEAGTISFDEKVDFPVGATLTARPSSMVAADFDGDGKLDLATADVESSFVTVLRNIGNRAELILFAPKVHFRTAFGPFSITAKDFDGDGKTDLATANFYSSTVSVLRNVSAADEINFEMRSEYVVGRLPVSIAGGDLNGDGKDDLAVSNFRSNDVSVLKNTSPAPGMIRFDAQAETAIAGRTPFSIAVGDFDGDNRRDLATANFNSNNITVLRNTTVALGTNSFAPGIEIALPDDSQPRWIAVRDFDGDGKDDIVTANSNLDTVSVLRNISAGEGAVNFAPPVNFAVGDNPYFVATADFDNDGKFDIAVVNHFSDSVSILKNNSSATGQIGFEPKVDFSVGSNPTSLAVNDFNADGLPDIAVANSNGGSISILENATRRRLITFAEKKDFSLNLQPLFIASDDFDGDGRPDIAVTGFAGSSGVVSVLRNVSAPGGEIEFAAKTDFPISSNSAPGHIITARIGGDDKPDIIVINNDSATISLLRNSSSGAGEISFQPRVDIPVSAVTSALAAGDFNRDGKQDIAYSSYNSNNVGVLQNVCRVNRRTLFDYDGDGKADVSVFRPSTGVWMIQNSSNNSFVSQQFGQTEDIIAPEDYDGDGKTDLAVFRPESGTWFLQQSASGFAAVQFGQAGDIPVPADFDGDGRADIAVFRPSSGVWFILRSRDGFIGFQFGQNGDKPVAADYDGDGKDDLAVVRQSGGASVWFVLASTRGFFAAQFGNETDKIVPADYDGDGVADLAVYRGGTWFLLRSQAGFAAISFGTAEDKPVAADFDGDGRADIAVFRPSSGAWFVLRSSGGVAAIPFGVSEDIPTPNAFVR
jgi:hypothetical protein